MPATDPLTLKPQIARHLAAIETAFNDELHSDLPVINELVAHVSRYRGKMLRPMLALLCGEAVGELNDAHTTIATVVEMVHMATLVHDDVLDEADLRRRGVTINRLRGNESAVMLGDYLISHSYHLCSSLGSQYAARVIARTTNQVCEGELLQLANRNNLQLDEETYVTIVSRKTGALIATSCLLGAHFAGADEATAKKLEKFGLSLGIAFQIQDDIMDLVGTTGEAGKTLGIDIAKCKLTLPIIHFLQTAPAEHRELCRELLTSGEHNAAERIRHLIMPSDSINYARGRAQRLVDRAKQSIADLPDTDAKRQLEQMADFVLTRKN